MGRYVHEQEIAHHRKLSMAMAMAMEMELASSSAI
jgi:hypothetical protein